MPTVPVSFFNANILDITVQVNNGMQFTIAGAVSPNYTPGLPTSGGPTWNYNGPANNSLGPGTNWISITPAQSVEPFTFPVTLPDRVQYTSVQLYVFWNSNKTVNWLILNNGSYVDGSLALGKPATGVGRVHP